MPGTAIHGFDAMVGTCSKMVKAAKVRCAHTEKWTIHAHVPSCCMWVDRDIPSGTKDR